MTKVRKFREYHESLMEDLKDPKEAQGYLNAALEDGDQRVFLLALKDVLEAQGGSFSSLAKRAQLNRESLYRTLSSRGNPKLTSLRAILNGIGLNLSVCPLQDIK